MFNRLATFYSRSREGRWCKGETSGNFITVIGVYLDCDRDSIIYLGLVCIESSILIGWICELGDPVGPACHTGAPTCWFSEIKMMRNDTEVQKLIDTSAEMTHTPHTTLYALEDIIEQRKKSIANEGSKCLFLEGLRWGGWWLLDGKPSWTAKLLSDPELLCEKIKEEAGELCQTLEKDEGKQRATEEMADLLYHSLVLLNKQVDSYQRSKYKFSYREFA